jgi:hypothetical protein
LTPILLAALGCTGQVSGGARQVSSDAAGRAGSGGATSSGGARGGGGATGGGGGRASTGGNTGTGGAPASIPTVDAAPIDPRPDANCAEAPGPMTTTVRDPKTCLVWLTAASGPRTNVAAAKFCDELVSDGWSDWRVPTPEEMATWPHLQTSSNAYVTGPTYVPSAARDADGCTGDAHSCNLAHYNPSTITCAWQGVGFTGPSLCVRGAAAPGTIPPTYGAASCEACKGHLGGEFRAANCLPFAH